MVDFKMFAKSGYWAVKIRNCVAVPKCRELMQFTLDDGSGTERTVLSGIHEYYEPDESIGRTADAKLYLSIKSGREKDKEKAIPYCNRG